MQNSRFTLSLASAALLLTWTATTRSQTAENAPIELDAVLVNANRISQLGSDSISASDFRINPSNVQTRHNLDLSETLGDYTGYSSFRRTRSYGAHPTTQGVRLRNHGATATSRTLVLYDGVPQNDPFGGWLYWHQYNTPLIEDILFSPSGAGTSWGNLGAGGLISLISANALPGSALIDISAGTSNTYNLNATTTQSINNNSYLDIGVRGFTSDGFQTLRADQRGSVDEPSSSDGYAFNARLRMTPSDDWNIQFSTRVFREERGNGTGVAQNETDAVNLSVVAERSLSNDAKLNIVLYHQDRSFENVFSSVAEDRNSERPALDQYDVPADAYGAAIAYAKQLNENTDYTIGLDYRSTKGSVNERFRNLGDGFTRDRNAGGEQNFAGAFAKASTSLSNSDTLSITARIDRIENRNASRTEIDTTNGNNLRSDIYANRANDELSSNLKWRHSFTDTLSSNVNLFTGFRAPTLNELYRPFRVRNDITEANPLLANEQIKGIELSLLSEQSDNYRINFALFHTEVDNMISNALLTTESGFDPRFGFIPAGGSGSQRLNMDKTTVSGFELQTSWTLSSTLQFSSSITYSDTEIDRDDLPQFIGKQFPQSSPLRARASIEYKPTEALNLWGDVSWADNAYDDLANTRRLGESSIVSLGAQYSINESQSLGIVIDNLFDEETRSGISNDGLVTIDAPREARITWSWRK